MNKIEMKNKARETLVNNLLEKLEEGNLIWRKGWGSVSCPYNEITKKPYRGLNHFILSFQSLINKFEDPRWLTFNQAKEKNYNIKKGSKSTPIEVSKYIDKESKQEVTKEFLDKKRTELSEEDFQEYLKNGFYRLQKTYLVFNGTQIEGLPKYEPIKMSDEEKLNRNERIENIIKNSEAKVFYDGNDRAYYNSKSDTIHIPERDKFISMEELYTTTLHEIGHSTGHEKRLNRNLQNLFGDENYAYEELVAELTSVLTAEDLSLKLQENEFDNHAAYIKSWYQLIKDDPDLLFKAIKDADKASEYVLSYEKLALKEDNNLTVDIIWSENSFINSLSNNPGKEPIILNLSFSEADFLLKTLDKYYPTNYGYEKTKFVIKNNKEEIYTGCFDIGDGMYIKPNKYGILEHIRNYAEKEIEALNNGHSFLLGQKGITKEEIEEIKKEYQEILDNFVPMLENNLKKMEFDLNKAKNLEEKIYLYFNKILISNKNSEYFNKEKIEENIEINRRKYEKSSLIYSQLLNKNTKENKTSINKIFKNMQDEKRADILDNKTLDIYYAQENIFFQKLGNKIENLESIANMQFVEAKRFFKKLESEFTHTGKIFENKDMEIKFEFTKHGLKESVEKQKSSYENYAKLLSCLPEVIDNAIGLEIHDDYKPDENKSIKNIYVLVSAFHDGKDIHPVKLLIKEFTDMNKSNKLYVAISLESFEIKKEEADIINTRSEPNGTRPASSQTSSINIIANYPLKSILENISIEDKDMIKYIPNRYLTGEKIEVKNKELSKNKEIKKIEKNIKLSQEEIESLENQAGISQDETYISKKMESNSMKDYKEYFKEKRKKTLENLEKNTPKEMKELKQWCAFKTYYDKENKKQKKLILDVNFKDAVKWAKCNDKTTWATFEDAMKYAKENDCAGLAFALTKESNITCIDLDHHIQNGKKTQLAIDLLNQSNDTYSEKSVSGQGIHIFTKSKILEENTALKNDNNNIECYKENRMISMTGNIISKNIELKEVNEDFIKIAKENLGEKEISKINEEIEYIVQNKTYVSDYEVIEKIRNSKVAGDFNALYSGKDLLNDHSRSDYKLMNILAFFTDCNISQMEDIFRSSGLYRKEKGEAYLKMTAKKAAATLSERAENLYKEKIEVKKSVDQQEK